MKKIVNVTIDGVRHHFEVEGSWANSSPEILLARDDDLSAATEWGLEGYTVRPFLARELMCQLRSLTATVVKDALRTVMVEPPPNLDLERYHEHIHDDGDHIKVVRQARTILDEHLGNFDIDAIDRRISEILDVDVSSIHPWHDRARVQLRIVRPDRSDFNPAHRDVWLDHLRNGINIYVPIEGSNARSSLPVVPGSHLWAESRISRTEQGATLNGVKYAVPSVLTDVEMTRPNPDPDQVLVFSPYMIHGLALNTNPNRTRVSIEMRFWRAGQDSRPW